jgi:hypothetical protein
MIKMNKISFVILVLILAAVFSGVAYAAIARPPIDTDYIMKVSMLNQMPDPAEPGKYVDLRFKFENNGSQLAENVEAEILPQYPFAIDPGTDPIISLSSINPQQKGDNGVIIKYRLRVDKDALEGQNPIKLRYRVNGQAWITMPEFNVNIQPYDAILVLEKVVFNPEVIKPGEKATADITFKNIAEISLNKVRVILDIGGAPIAPIGSTNEKVIEKIDKNEEADVKFNIVGEPNAQSGIYKVGVAYIYYDALGNAYSRNSTIGLIIGSDPDLLVGIDSTTIYQSGTTGEVTVKIVNKGVNEIKFLNVKLAESGSYRMISPSEVYVGNIDSDDYETADFKLALKDKGSNDVILPLKLEYRDANNKEYTQDIELKLTLYDTSEAKELGLVQGNGKVGFVVVIVVVVAGLFIYLRWRRHRKKKI